MLMFRFWGSERGSEKTVAEACHHPMPEFAKPQHPIIPDTAVTAHSPSPPRPLKRRRQSIADGLAAADDLAAAHVTPSRPSPPLKRAKQDLDCSSLPVDASLLQDEAPRAAAAGMDDVRDAIQYQFGLEILLKHNELRLVNQELAKCQVALEQLRRCHLIPYPVTCPTPDQMLDIANGKGPALQSHRGAQVPRWAAPFGVVEGPYARHYAKWLIPDPKFDGMQPEWQPVFDSGRKATGSLEGRTTRNSFTDFGAATTKGRPLRGVSGQKLHSLSSGYPQPKEKAGPCVLKRADGQTVKLVCIDCHRENFSSTQGFINHCRIAHRRDFKSHEEAAVHSGHPIEVNEPGAAAPEDKANSAAPSHPSAPPAPAVPSGLVHPFAHAELSTQQAYVALRSRIADSLKLYHQGKLPGVTGIPATPSSASPSKPPSAPPASTFVSAPDAPFLSRLMQSRKFNGDLSELVREAKQKMTTDDMFSPGEDSEDADQAFDGAAEAASAPTRAPVVMRVPARTAMPPAAPLAIPARPTSSKGRSPHLGFASPSNSIPDKEDDARVMMLPEEDVDMDADLSPNTLVSNNAPSLVSDDGEYDDSDDGSSDSGASDSLEAESVSDVAEINIDDEHEPRGLRHHRGSTSATTMRLKKEDSKHVTFISPVKNNAKRARNV